jgi:hypothetical protein
MVNKMYIPNTTYVESPTMAGWYEPKTVWVEQDFVISDQTIKASSLTPVLTPVKWED